MKTSKGTPRNLSNVRKLRKSFETSTTRGPIEMLSQLTQSSRKGIKFKPATTTQYRNDSENLWGPTRKTDRDWAYTELWGGTSAWTRSARMDQPGH